MKKRMRRWMTAASLAVIVGVGAAPAAKACDDLRIMGFPESCVAACKFGGHSLGANVSCMFDLFTDW